MKFITLILVTIDLCHIICFAVSSLGGIFIHSPLFVFCWGDLGIGGLLASNVYMRCVVNGLTFVQRARLHFYLPAAFPKIALSS